MLDTNVLHWVSLYLSYAEGKHRYPHHDVQWPVTRAYIEKNVSDLSARAALISGGRVLHFMCSNKAEFVRSAAVEAEWFRIEASSRGLRKAIARSRVAGRWFSQLKADEVNRLMSPQDYQALIASLQHMCKTLDSLGLRVTGLESTSTSDAVWLARGIMSLVYMDAMDSVVYANALVAACTHLVTSDTQFRRVVNAFQNPTSQESMARSKELTSLIKVSTGLQLASRELPVSPRIRTLDP